jgi:hypothetical protein
VPRAGAARVMEIAEAMRGDRPIEIQFIGVRPGEKTHEVLVSEEELGRTSERNGYYVIAPMLPGLAHTPPAPPCLDAEYSSASAALNGPALAELIESSRSDREAS